MRELWWSRYHEKRRKLKCFSWVLFRHWKKCLREYFWPFKLNICPQCKIKITLKKYSRDHQIPGKICEKFKRGEINNSSESQSIWITQRTNDENAFDGTTMRQEKNKKSQLFFTELYKWKNIIVIFYVYCVWWRHCTFLYIISEIIILSFSLMAETSR